MLAEHTAHARFLRDAGGLNLQLIDERPPGRDVTADGCARLGGLLTEIGRRAAGVGVQVVYHPHMGTIGERPENAERVLAASDPSLVKLLLDVAHYTQGGGDPAAAIRRHHARIGLLHIKDVAPMPVLPGFRFVELGRGRVDLPAVFEVLRDVRYDGWAVVELDDVVGRAERRPRLPRTTSGIWNRGDSPWCRRKRSPASLSRWHERMSFAHIQVWPLFPASRRTPE